MDGKRPFPFPLHLDAEKNRAVGQRPFSQIFSALVLWVVNGEFAIWDRTTESVQRPHLCGVRGVVCLRG